MFNVGGGEIMLLLVFALVIFGPKRLPEIARQVGKAMREVRKFTGTFQDEVRTHLALDEVQSEPTYPYPTPISEEKKLDPIESQIVEPAQSQSEEPRPAEPAETSANQPEAQEPKTE